MRPREPFSLSPRRWSSSAGGLASRAAWLKGEVAGVLPALNAEKGELSCCGVGRVVPAESPAVLNGDWDVMRLGAVCSSLAADPAPPLQFSRRQDSAAEEE